MKYDPRCYQLECPRIPLEDPPCRFCACWHPQQIFKGGPGGLIPHGVKLCHKIGDGMQDDFSCFEEKAAEKQGEGDVS